MDELLVTAFFQVVTFWNCWKEKMENKWHFTIKWRGRSAVNGNNNNKLIILPRIKDHLLFLIIKTVIDNNQTTFTLSPHVRQGRYIKTNQLAAFLKNKRICIPDIILQHIVYEHHHNITIVVYGKPLLPIRFYLTKNAV